MAGDSPSSAMPIALQGFARLGALHQAGLAAALAAAVALGVTVALWARDPGYSLLYTSLSAQDAAAVVEGLERAGIRHRVDRTSGAVLVPGSQVHEARMKLAAAGLPRAGEPGFEVLERNSTLGTSQFLERARFQRALEVELARTVAAIRSVDQARVHLALPRESAFVRDPRRASASVLVQLAPGGRLEPEQAAAIAHLVAAAAPGLVAEDVRVIDERGRVLGAPEGDDAVSLTDKEFEHTRRIETALEQRILEILAPMVGRDAVRAQVTARLDFTRSQETREAFRPDPTALRSEQVVEERSLGPGAGGVPGALSNQPPAAGAAPEQLGVGADGEEVEEAGRWRRQSTRNFELDRTLEVRRPPVGGLQKLSVAVLVDHRRGVDAEGRPILEAWGEADVERMRQLAGDAVGLDPERGDSLSVVNAPFSVDDIEPLAGPALWEQPWVRDALRQVGAAGLVLLLVFGVLRPATRQLAARELSARALEPPRREESPVLAATGAGADPSATPAGLPGPPASSSASSLETARSLVVEDPRRAANVVRSWVGDHG